MIEFTGYLLVAFTFIIIFHIIIFCVRMLFDESFLEYEDVKNLNMSTEEDNKIFLKNFITIELAKKLKDIGFKERCFLYFYIRNPDRFYFELDKMENNYKGTDKNMEFIGYNDSLHKVSLPEYETAFNWFREQGYIVNIAYDFSKHLRIEIGYYYEIIFNNTIVKFNGYFKTYEIARENCLRELIEIYEKQDN